MPINSGTKQYELQAALYPFLDEHPDITFQVHDHVPENEPFPFAAFGDTSSDEYNTKTTQGERILVTFHLWSDYQGKRECKELLGTLERVLRQFQTEGLHRVGKDEVDIFTEGYLTHGVLVMHFIFFEKGLVTA